MIFSDGGILAPVMNMKSGKQVLCSLLKTAQMGQIGIRSVLQKAAGPAMRKALESQLQEYDTIEIQAHGLAARRGWELPELDPAVRAIADMMTRVRVNSRDPDPGIARLMIQGNTRGMIKGLSLLHRFDGRDGEVLHLSQKLLDCQEANIRQMQQLL